MSNILKAIHNLVNNPVVEISNHYKSRNRANAVGDALEEYVKDLFADTILEKDRNKLNIAFSKVFSYTGNQNNPPDIILKNGDAIEVKKIQGKASGLALNSSYPKAKLYADNPMIKEACRNCEAWDVKDIIYIVGNTTDTSINWLWFVYGDCYAADKGVYERIREKISQGVNEIPNVEFAQTKELGRVNKVDPLGITNLRIRGMWHISSPNKVFDYLDKIHESKFKLNVLMRKSKYNYFSERDKVNIENTNSIKVEDVEIPNPNNPANLLEAKFIQFIID